MSKFKVGDKVKVGYVVDGSVEVYTIKKIFDAETFLSELDMVTPTSGYLWQDESGRFFWDEQYDVDNNNEMCCTLIFSAEETSSQQQNDMYPHTCPRCGAPAYKGLNDIECSSCGRF